jgi:hypothetical protein
MTKDTQTNDGTRNGFANALTDAISVSCARAGTCATGGYYTDRSGHSQGFVVNRSE